ncbi:ribonuclease J [Sphingosinicella microcystinivorans]|uniref:ribonuclease J n=1 Tax=Sphingosinicella microcystinivorans TaxID=335406 RepID=UPI0022F3A914|nr:ribonuclease J [Sphingosinicella microcystinivorans]WBX83403.1 ribonuclease J [Sphingosinicella microcystinivorans]
MKPGKELIFLPLGGSGEIGMNVNLYGCNGKWIMVDLGMTFADPNLPGIELVLPDLSFIEDRQKDLLGIVLTHGHEDHIGAIPYLVGDFDVPLYATPFTAGLIRKKLIEEGIERDVELNVVPLEGEVNLGPFKCRYVPLAHSIPEGNALLIETPYGKIFHTGDWKLDEAPVLGVPSTAEELTALGDEGILALVGDSTNVFNPEASGSETGVREGLDKVIAGHKGRVLVTTFASNAARLHTLGEVAKDTGRRICVVGRSLDRILEVSKSVGYLTDFPPTVSQEEAMNLPRDKLLIVSTGAQGEARAALSRIAEGEHSHIKLERGDLVVYSSKQIPGNEIAIGRVQNALAAAGVEIITDRQAHVHVSGHPGIPELEAMYGWICPQISIPVHGERRHMEEHARLARRVGVPEAVVPVNGSAIRLAPGKPQIISHEPVGRLVLDGDVILPADGATMLARRRMMHNGLIAVFVVLDGKGRLLAPPQVQSHGVPVEDDRDEFIDDCVTAASEAAAKARGSNEDALAEAIRVAVRRKARDWTGKKPITEVTVTRIKG